MAAGSAATKAGVKSPAGAELKSALGKAAGLWTAIVDAVGKAFAPLEQEWRPSKLEFGRMCLLRQKGRTLVYLVPMAGQMLVGVVLGQRAYEIAQGSKLRPAIKQILAETKPTAEGRGIRFVVKTEADVAEVVTLARCVMKGT